MEEERARARRNEKEREIREGKKRGKQSVTRQVTLQNKTDSPDTQQQLLTVDPIRPRPPGSPFCPGGPGGPSLPLNPGGPGAP